MKKPKKIKKIKAVVLDMDGLMIDTEPLYKYSMQKSAEELGYPLSDEFMMQLVGRPDSDCKKIILEKISPDFPLDTFWEQWPKAWRSYASSKGIARKPGLTELLDYISDAKLPAAIATSTYQEQADFSLKAAGVTNTFTHMVTGDEVSKGKPAPDIYLEAARRLGMDPEYCVALEDSENGIRSASSAGMVTIMIPDLIQPADEIRGMADHIVDSLHEARNLIARMT